jgi:hypothetical protein
MGCQHCCGSNTVLEGAFKGGGVMAPSAPQYVAIVVAMHEAPGLVVTTNNEQGKGVTACLAAWVLLLLLHVTPRAGGLLHCRSKLKYELSHD